MWTLTNSIFVKKSKMSFKEDSARRFKFFIRKNTVFSLVFPRVGHFEATNCKMRIFFCSHIGCVVRGPPLWFWSRQLRAADTCHTVLTIFLTSCCFPLTSDPSAHDDLSHALQDSKERQTGSAARRGCTHFRNSWLFGSRASSGKTTW